MPQGGSRRAWRSVDRRQSSWRGTRSERADAQRRRGYPRGSEVVDVLGENLAGVPLRLDCRSQRRGTFTIRRERQRGHAIRARDERLIARDVRERDAALPLRASNAGARLEDRHIALRLRPKLLGLRNRDLCAVAIEEWERNGEPD